LLKGHRNFNIYGTARSDKINTVDNTLKVKVNNINEIFGKGQEKIVI